MLDFNKAYGKVEIIEDGSNGRIKLSAINRQSEDRKTKLKNNFVGVLDTADSRLVLELCQELNKKLPDVSDDEIVVGMYKSGIIMAGYLAMVRKAKFTWSTPDEFGDFQDAVQFQEGHRKTATHYFYGLKPGNKIILVEDEITSGLGVADLTKVLRDYNIEVVAICSILETINFGGRDLIKTKTGLELESLVKVEVA